MPQRAEWMNDASIPVLDTFADAGIAVSAGAVELELNRRMKRPPSRSTITRAIRKLREHSLVVKPEEDSIYYEITDKGRAYLAGDLDASDLNTEDG